MVGSYLVEEFVPPKFQETEVAEPRFGDESKFFCVVFLMLPVGSWTKGGAQYGSHFSNITHFSHWGASNSLLQMAAEQAKLHPTRDLFQFGVYTGGSMMAMAKKIPHFRRLWGFDSFQGVPEEDSSTELGHPTWRPGGWSPADALRTYDVDVLMSRIRNRINHTRVVLVPGFFNESLPKMDLRSVRPPLVVDVDCDLYISARQALDWVFGSGLACPGMLVRYDDWFDSGDGGEALGFHPGSWKQIGEVRAHHEITQRYQLTWVRLVHNEFMLRSMAAGNYSRHCGESSPMIG